MALEKDNIKDLFASKLSNFEPEVPTSLWAGLDQVLSNQPIQPPVDSSSSSSASSSGSSASSGASAGTSAAGGAKAIAIGVGIAATVAVGVTVVTNSGDDPIIVPLTESITESELQNINPSNIFADSSMIEPTTALFTDYVKPSRSVTKEKTTTEKPVMNYTIADVSLKTGLLEEGKMGRKNFFITLSKIPIALADQMAKADMTLAVAANASMLNGDVSKRGGGNMLFSKDIRGKEFMAALDKENSEFHIDHKQPINFGLIVGKQLTPKISIETGLVYTYLSSKVTSNSIYGINEDQKFNYLGIPINVNYSLFKLGKADIYVSAGVLVQKDISGTYRSSVAVPQIGGFPSSSISGGFYFNEPDDAKIKISQSNPQFSVNSTLGISYPIYKKLYIYGTVGGAYYFDAENKYRTIYSDQPTQLNINMGLKIDF